MKGERNTENKNLKNVTEIRDRDYAFVCSLHKLFYISPLKTLEKDNWNVLCQVLFINFKNETKVLGDREVT